MVTVLIALVAFGLGLFLSKFVFTQVKKLEKKND